MSPTFSTSTTVNHVDFYGTVISIDARHVRKSKAITGTFTTDSFDATRATKTRSLSAFDTRARNATGTLFRDTTRTSATFRLANGIFDGRDYVRFNLFSFYSICISDLDNRNFRHFFGVFGAYATATSSRTQFYNVSGRFSAFYETFSFSAKGAYSMWLFLWRFASLGIFIRGYDMVFFYVPFYIPEFKGTSTRSVNVGFLARSVSLLVLFHRRRPSSS